MGTATPARVAHGKTGAPRAPALSGRFLYLAGLFALGLAVGYFCGLSESPVVATLLPLLFALIGGANGVFIVGLKAGSKVPTDRLRLGGLALLNFCIATIISSAYGIAVRTGASLDEFLPTTSVKKTGSGVVSEKGQASDDLKLALLDSQLSALGVVPAERRRIVAKAAQSLTGPIDEVALGELELLSRKAQTVVELLKPAVGPLDERQIPKADFAKDAPHHPVVVELYLKLRNAQVLCKQWTDTSKSKTAPFVARSSVVGLVSDLERSALAMHGSPVANRRRASIESISVYQWLENTFVAFDLAPLLDIEQYIHFLNAKYGSGEWLEDADKLGESVNKFLMARSQQVAPSAKPRPAIRP